jgi:cobalt/nickel transport system permease protein
MVGSLFLRAYERSERIYAAMQARGFEGEFRHLRARALARTDIAALVVGLGLLAAWAVVAILWLPQL